MGVVGHDNAAKEDGHDPREVEPLCKEVGTKRKQEPHRKLQRVVLSEIHKLQKLKEGRKSKTIKKLIRFEIERDSTIEILRYFWATASDLCYYSMSTENNSTCI